MWELWGIEISPLPLKRHIAYTTATAQAVIHVLYLEVITWLFSYRPVYQAQASITARGVAEGSCRLKA